MDVFQAQHIPDQVREVAARIRELREISGYTQEEMARFTEVPVETYRAYEEARADLPFTFLHKCALTFKVDMIDLMEGRSAQLSSYTITRKGAGEVTAREQGIDIRNLAPMFRKKISEPYFVRYSYEPDLQDRPIHTTTHSGQEFDYILSGTLKVQVGDHIELLREGDSIYYDSHTPHGMIAAEGQDCVFLAVVLPGEETEERQVMETIKASMPQEKALVSDRFVHTVEDEGGALKDISFSNLDSFNFAFDIVDELAQRRPDALAMLHLDKDQKERRFTFLDMKKQSNRTANYFRSLGIKKGDKVLLVLRRQYHFWLSMLALCKIGAIAIPATDQLLPHDYEYRFNKAEVSAVLCTAYGQAAQHVEDALPQCPSVKTLVLCGGSREGWHDFDADYEAFSSRFARTEDTPAGSYPMVMFFTSGTTGYPKLVAHSHTYPLGHYITARYWHCVVPGRLHFTISDTGWGKALWGKLYGQWLCEAPVFVYDFERFHADQILPLFKKYDITTFCAPPTMYRMLIKEDLEKYDLSSIRHATIAGEALNPEVFYQFQKATGLSLMEGFGQTETTLSIGNLVGMAPKPGSMGKPSPLYDVDLVDANGKPVPTGETGEIVIRLGEGRPACGLYLGYLGQDNSHPDGYYHTGDTAWRDEDGYYWYVGRVDDLIKSSGYRIGPFEIESVIMELPYVLECGVSAAPDPLRGQVVKASIVLVKGK
ncbi:MAG: AMP-binding protein, partial [Clostridiales bacterium]|nr:AMP-binding protein [Clostridiales bacterium]